MPWGLNNDVEGEKLGQPAYFHMALVTSMELITTANDYTEKKIPSVLHK